MLFVVAAWVVVLAATLGLRSLNLRHLQRHGAEIPAELQGLVGPARLQAMVRYTQAHDRLDLARLALSNTLLALFFFGGVLGAYDAWIVAHVPGFVRAGVLFFACLWIADTVLRLPLNLVEHFRVEKRFGFNRMGPRLWLADLLKSLGLSLVLLALVTAGALGLVRWSPGLWWLWVWGFFLVVTLFLMYVSPYVIEPLFFKLEPLRLVGLEEAIRALLATAGLRASRVFQMDASRRSTHSNAYFTGLGRVKRIDLFDTLLTQLETKEILAVLAHEAGHWKLRHVLKQIVRTEVVALGVLFLAARLLDSERLPGLVGLETASFHARVLILAFLGALIAVAATPLPCFLSRRHEWQADRFAVELCGDAAALAAALAKLARDNLSNLHPHPLYVWFHFSHPPVVERIRRLRQSLQE